MKSFVAAMTGLLLGSSVAMAAPINGTLSLDGDDTFSAASVTFVGEGNVGDDSGSYSEIGPCDLCVAFASSITTATNSGVLFTASNAGDTAQYTLTGPLTFTFVPNVDPSLDSLTVTGSGIMTLTGFDATPSDFTLTTQGPTNSDVTFSTTAVSVPAPPLSWMGVVFAGVIWLSAKLWRRKEIV
jgi:hypothetical protein